MSEFEMPASKRVRTEEPVDEPITEADLEPQFGTVQYHDEFGEWRTVPGYPDHVVLVSDQGYVRTRNPRGTAFEAPNKRIKDVHDYCRINFKLGPFEPRKRTTVHQLVARAFLGPCPPGETVDHYSRVRTDNSVANLRYRNPSEQMKNRKEHVANRHARPVFVRHQEWPDTTPSLWFASVTAAKRACDLERKPSLQSRVPDKSGGIWVVSEAPPKEPQEDLPAECVDGEQKPAEEWRDAIYRDGTPIDSIRVSNRGRVQCKIGHSGHWSHKVTPKVLEKCGYVLIGPCKSLHVAVWCTFNGPIAPEKQVYHIRADTNNNSLSNLQVVTPPKNSAKRTFKPLEERNLQGARAVEVRLAADESAPWQRYVSCAAAGRAIGAHNDTIGKRLGGPGVVSAPWNGFVFRVPA